MHINNIDSFKINNFTKNFQHKTSNSTHNNFLNSSEKNYNTLESLAFGAKIIIAKQKNKPKTDITTSKTAEINPKKNKMLLDKRLPEAKNSGYGWMILKISNVRYKQMQFGLTYEQINALNNRMIDYLLFDSEEITNPIDNFDFLQSLSPNQISKMMADTHLFFQLGLLLYPYTQKTQEEYEEIKQKLLSQI